MRRVVLEAATLNGDNVVGRLTSVDTLRRDGWISLRSGDGERTAIAISAISRVERRQLDKRRVFGPLVVAGVATAVLVAVVAK